MHNELYHHGILGQKWGVRRFQNEDGALTDAGKKRYSADITGQKQRLKEARANERKLKWQWKKEYYTRFGNVTKETANSYKEATERTDWERRKLSDEITKDALNRSSGKKSKHRLALEQKYIDKGMTQEEAEIAAYKRIRTERAIAIAGGVTLAAAAAYVAYKHWDNDVDKVIKNVELKNISDTDRLDVSRPFYAAYKGRDVKEYLGLYGNQLKDGGAERIHQTTIGINGGLKVAGRTTATKALAGVVKADPNMMRELHNDLNLYETQIAGGQTFAGKQLARRARHALANGRITKDVYDVVNSAQTARGEQSSAGKKVYAELTKAGFNAILDVNDKTYGGYHTKAPLIVFNGAANTVVKSVREVGNTELSNAYTPEYVKAMTRATVMYQLPTAATFAGISGAVAGSRAYASKQKRDKIVAEYKRRHPDTKLSYNQIVENYYGSK